MVNDNDFMWSIRQVMTHWKIDKTQSTGPITHTDRAFFCLKFRSYTMLKIQNISQLNRSPTPIYCICSGYVLNNWIWTWMWLCSSLNPLTPLQTSKTKSDSVFWPIFSMMPVFRFPILCLPAKHWKIISAVTKCCSSCPTVTTQSKSSFRRSASIHCFWRCVLNSPSCSTDHLCP